MSRSSRQGGSTRARSHCKHRDSNTTGNRLEAACWALGVESASVLNETLERVVDDFDQLYECYTNGGLLGGARFSREFLLIDALVRNRVGRAAGNDDGLRHLVVFGGNNVGKSTIINILAGRSLASVRPTRPQAISKDMEPGWHRTGRLHCALSAMHNHFCRRHRG